MRVGHTPWPARSSWPFRILWNLKATGSLKTHRQSHTVLQPFTITFCDLVDQSILLPLSRLCEHGSDQTNSPQVHWWQGTPQAVGYQGCQEECTRNWRREEGTSPSLSGMSFAVDQKSRTVLYRVVWLQLCCFEAYSACVLFAASQIQAWNRSST